MTKDILHLGSQSSARQRLLEFAKIRYALLTHASDEMVDHTQGSFEQNVLAIAKHKMETLILPSRASVASDKLFTLTADTLVRSTQTGKVLGKPNDRAHAIEMLQAERESPVEVVTGCCLEKFRYHNDRWEQQDAIHWATGAIVEFYVEAESVDQYLSTFPFILQCSGAGMVEDHGLSYLKSVNGSYTAVIGLPLYELRQALKQLGFLF
ncbi:MAG: yhdE [Gammaproteobacteria bacterium]|jgi:septum formation protein|nr:yhdE [Gammaproteobacteria bacterium]